MRRLNLCRLLPGLPGLTWRVERSYPLAPAVVKETLGFLADMPASRYFSLRTLVGITAASVSVPDVH